MLRDEIKFQLRNMISNLRSMADEYEDLLKELDNLSDADFNQKNMAIQDKYQELGIELF